MGIKMRHLKKELSKEKYLSVIPAWSGSHESYVNYVNQIPLLSAEEETQLAQQLTVENDLMAAKRLILSHLRFVVHIARNYQGYGLPLADLIQEGNIGLMKAVKRFDPKWGVRLVSFAVHWIKAEIHEYVIRNWRIIKIATTKAQRKLFFNLRSLKKNYETLNKVETQMIADTLKVSAQEVKEMEKRLYAQDIAFNPISDEEEEFHSFSPEEYLHTIQADSDPALVLEKINSNSLQHEYLKKALVKLDVRTREIITSRWLKDKKLTLHDLAKKYKVSPERIRQIEETAFKSLKKALSPII